MVGVTSTPESKQTNIEPLIVLRGVRWNTYKALMADVGDDRAWRIAYDQGILEIRMPLLQHEVPKGLLKDFVTAVADELEIEILKAGALTLEREDLTCAVEPDTCFYIQNETQVRGLEAINLLDNPPPDLVIESDYTSSSINKFSLYVALGVPEIWRYRKNALEVYRLNEGNYQREAQSKTFPFLPIAEIPGFIEQSKIVGQRTAVRLFQKRIRDLLANQSANLSEE